MAQSKAAAGRPMARPLTPHLQIYRMTVSMLMSILHRVTGGALYFGTLLLAWWLIAAAVGPAYFDFVNGIFGSWVGRFVLFGYSWALIHHMLGGLRHLVWDTGRGFQIPTVNRMSWATIIGSVVLTSLLWAGALALKGGF